jgi:hypothetical protein
MTVADAITVFIRESRTNSSDNSQLWTIEKYLPITTDLSDISPALLKNTIGRWAVERPETGNRPGLQSGQHASSHAPATTSSIDLALRFFSWCEGDESSGITEAHLSELRDLQTTITVAQTISSALALWLRGKRGAFGFSEFLTSFEDGGHSEYDLQTITRDPSEKESAIESYFKVLRVDGTVAEVEDVISGMPVGPVEFPEAISDQIAAGYTLNLELIRDNDRWQIVDAGLVYPPGVDF